MLFRVRYEDEKQGMFPVVIGGDHTSALGFHSGLARAHGKTGIIWVDTHPDLNIAEQVFQVIFMEWF